MNTGPASSRARATASHGSIFGGFSARFGPSAASLLVFFFFPALGFLFSPGPLLRSLFLLFCFLFSFLFSFVFLFFCFLVEPKDKRQKKTKKQKRKPKSKKENKKEKKKTKKAKKQKSKKAKKHKSKDRVNGKKRNG
jgi:Na+/melibiose symporter-like transporter